MNLEPIGAPDEGPAFLNQVTKALAVGSHGVGFDVFTGKPVQ